MSATRWLRQVGAAALAAGLGPVVAAAQPAPPAPSAAATKLPADLQARVAASLQQDAAQLRRGPSQGEREEAARRLVARQTAAADEVIREVMRGDDVPSRVAVARAVADDPTPDPQLISPLAALLNVDPGAAAYALAAFADRADALAQVIAYINRPGPRRDPALLTPAVRALGTTVDQGAAGLLVTLLQDSRQPAAVRDAAAEALGDLTLLRENGTDAAAWQQWWAANQPTRKPAVQFKADLADRYKRQRPTPPPDTYPMLEDVYRGQTTPENRPAFLKRILASPDPTLRAAGVRLVNKFEVSSGRGLSPDVQERIRQLVADSAPEVRLAAARLLESIGDKGAINLLLTALAQEPDAGVRAGVTEQLWRVKDLRILPDLVRLLDDPAPRVAVAAAQSLGQPEFVALLRPTPQAVGDVTAALTRAMGGRGAQAGGAAVRAAAAEALAQVNSPAAGGPATPGSAAAAAVDAAVGRMLQLLRPHEPPAVRRAALNGLAALGDNRVVSAVTRALEEDPDPDVRRAALATVGRLGTFGLATLVYKYMTPAGENDPGVRQEARRAFVDLAASGSEKEISDWANDKAIRADPDLRLALLVALEPKHASPDARADTRENIGDAYLRRVPAQPNEAAKYFKQAIDYWREKPGQTVAIDRLIGEYIEALLAGKNYGDAVQFAEDAIQRDATQTQRMANVLTTAAERLVESRNPTDALRLLNAIDRFPPVQTGPYPARRADARAAATAATPSSRPAPPGRGQ